MAATTNTQKEEESSPVPHKRCVGGDDRGNSDGDPDVDQWLGLVPPPTELLSEAGHGGRVVHTPEERGQAIYDNKPNQGRW